MIVEIKTPKTSATPWDKIPDGIFKGKLQNSSFYADCVWFKCKDKIFMIQNLSYNSGTTAVNDSGPHPSEMFNVEPIQFKGV